MDLDESLQLLSSRYRRWLLYVLMEREAGGLTELIPVLWVLSMVTNGKGISKRQISIKLQQIHLPKLNDAGFIDYDRRNGDIVLSERSDELREMLVAVEKWEEPAVQAKLQEEGFLSGESVETS